jgi:hypothetical protein
MANKPELRIAIGESFEVTLLSDKPLSGTNANGEWNMYEVRHDDVDYVHFASAMAHETLKNNGLNDVVKIEHKNLAGGKSVYDVRTIKKGSSNKESNPGNSDTELQIKWGMSFNNATRIVVAKNSISATMGNDDEIVKQVSELTNKLFKVACSMPELNSAKKIESDDDVPF